jgi:hypothetical protein
MPLEGTLGSEGLLLPSLRLVVAVPITLVYGTSVDCCCAASGVAGLCGSCSADGTSEVPASVCCISINVIIMSVRDRER